MKKIIANKWIWSVPIVAVALVLFFGFYDSKDLVASDSSETEAISQDELFPEEEVTAPNSESELYVELNNKVINAINSYEEGTITEEEYLKICEEIYSQIDSEEEMEKLEKSEDAYNDN